MSNCDQYLPELCAWLDGELEDSRELEAHLASCASCRAIAAQYRRIDAAIANVTPPANLHSHIMSGITASHSPKAKRRFAFKSATAVAATAAALLLVVGAGLIALPHWSGVGQSAEAADTAVYASEPASAPVVNYAASTTTSLTTDAAVEETPAETEVALYDDAEAIAEEVATEAAVPALEAANGTAAKEDTKYAAADTSAEAPAADVIYEVVTSGGDLTPYPEAEAEMPADEPAEEPASEPAAPQESFIVGGTVDGYAGPPLSDSDVEELQLRIAAGDQLTWTIYGTHYADLPFMLRDNAQFVRVGEEDIWVTTLETDAVFELYLILAEDLGGDLTFSDNETGSIMLDCR